MACNHEKLERHEIMASNPDFDDLADMFAEEPPMVIEETPYGMACLFCSRYNNAIKNREIQPPPIEVVDLPPIAPSLVNHCMDVIAKRPVTAELLGHLFKLFKYDKDNKQRLVNKLIDHGKMNDYVLELLLQDSPTEIRLKSCMGLKTAQHFQHANLKSLVTLQLDECHLSMYTIIFMYFPKSPNSLPSLRTLSMRGAKSLFDNTLEYLLKLAPSLQCVNIGGCSNITCAAIETLLDILKGSLKELYIDNCKRINVKKLISSFKKIQHLEVLWVKSVFGINDSFVIDLVATCGGNLKELNLSMCSLTDQSMEAIGRHCPQLCLLDVSLSKVRDLSLCFIANGCRSLTTFRLAHNENLSDEAVAAFVEVAGRSLSELSLDCVSKVGYCTALALGTFSKELTSLDLSGCNGITSDQLLFIVNGCPSLKLLKLYGLNYHFIADFQTRHFNKKLVVAGWDTRTLYTTRKRKRLWEI